MIGHIRLEHPNSEHAEQISEVFRAVIDEVLCSDVPPWMAITILANALAACLREMEDEDRGWGMHLFRITFQHTAEENGIMDPMGTA